MLQGISKLRALALAATLGSFLAFSSPSSATAFQVTFDPELLYGTAIFDLQEACLANDGNYDKWWELLALAKSGCYITFGGASISITGKLGQYTEYNTIIPFDLVLFTHLIVSDHDLAGITTLILLEPVSTAAEAAAFTLQTSSSLHECHEALLFTAAGDVKFWGCGSDGQRLPALTGDVIGIARIPEPGTLALLAGAGLAGWWVRRRRQRAG